MNTIDQIIKTTEITLAAYLSNRGYRLDRITKDGTIGTFWFIDVPDFELHEFDFGNSRVEPRQYHQAIQILTKTVRETK
jgi:hypothetical protein